MNSVAPVAHVEVSIRPACEADAKVLALLMAELGYPTQESVLRERLAALPQAGDQALVAITGAQVLGLVVLHRTHFLHRAPDGRIVTLVVAAAQRSNGIGARLVAAAEQVFRAWGCGRVEVSSGATRENAHRFYRRQGYAEQSKRFVKELAS
ncbi:GNAT family N-acetyltransferase [Hymenobacter terricola]|uniref:GNAT family N-acetyltransferase n=1 Tax=Hymenobacter terricola TaxID=2819236 RepID=UPI001B304FC5|nr:GNAT family N-acetyltransferase [Hymenobacter terricola]